MTGVYTITNKIDGKIYIGMSANIEHRWRVHKSHLRKNKHSCIYLQNAWNKYGEGSFLFEILEECDKDLLCSLEHYWVNILDARNPIHGYNYRSTHPDCKYCQTERTKQKISQRRKEWILNNPDYSSFENISLEAKERAAKKRRKAVIQYDKNGNIIREFSSLKETEPFGFTMANVSACCRGRVYTHMGYVFKFKEEKFIPGKDKREKPIKQYDLNYNLIKEWTSTPTLCEEMGLNKQSVYEAISSKTSLFGYKYSR